jgi:hypothetical protein
MKKIPTRLYFTFTECEHNGDLENYSDDVRKAGGTIISSRVDPEAEEGYMTLEVDDEAEFWDKFNKTDASDFVE